MRPVPRANPPTSNRPTISFSDAERMLISDHYGAREIRLASAPRVVRNAPLPCNSCYKRLPVDLDRRLPPVRRGYARVVVGSDVALIELNTLRVVDVLPGIAG